MDMRIVSYIYFPQGHSSRWQVAAQYRPQRSDSSPESSGDTHWTVISVHRSNTCAFSAVGWCFHMVDDSDHLSAATEEGRPLKVPYCLFSPSVSKVSGFSFYSYSLGIISEKMVIKGKQVT